MLELFFFGAKSCDNSQLLFTFSLWKTRVVTSFWCPSDRLMSLLIILLWGVVSRPHNALQFAEVTAAHLKSSACHVNFWERRMRFSKCRNGVIPLIKVSASLSDTFRGLLIFFFPTNLKNMERGLRSCSWTSPKSAATCFHNPIRGFNLTYFPKSHPLCQ